MWIRNIQEILRLIRSDSARHLKQRERERREFEEEENGE